MVEEIYKQEEMEDVEETTTEEAAAAAANEAKSSEDHKNIVYAETAMHHHHHHRNNNNIIINNKAPSTTTTTVVALLQGAARRRSEINASLEKDPSKNTINYGQYSLGNEAVVHVQGNTNITTAITTTSTAAHHDDDDDESLAVYGSFTAISSPENAPIHGRRNQDHYATNISAAASNRRLALAPSLVGMGTQAAAAAAVGGDQVSLTLGLQHSENVLPRKREDFSIRNFGTY